MQMKSWTKVTQIPQWGIQFQSRSLKLCMLLTQLLSSGNLKSRKPDSPIYLLANISFTQYLQNIIQGSYNLNRPSFMCKNIKSFILRPDLANTSHFNLICTLKKSLIIVTWTNSHRVSGHFFSEVSCHRSTWNVQKQPEVWRGKASIRRIKQIPSPLQSQLQVFKHIKCS